MSQLTKIWSLNQSAANPPKSRQAQVIGWLILAFLTIFLVNALVAAVVEGGMYPGVKLGNLSLALRTRSQSRQAIGSLPDNYKLTIQSQGKTFTTTTGEIGAAYDTDSTLALAYNQGRGTIPLLGVLSNLHDAPLGYVYKLDAQKLSRFSSYLVTQIGTPPVDATLVVQNGDIKTVAEKNGISIKPDTLSTIIAQSLNTSTAQTINVTPEPVTADITTTQLSDARQSANQILARQISVRAKGKLFTAQRSDIGHWVIFTETKTSSGKQLVAKLDPTQVKGWVQSVANALNVPPKNKKITVRDGVSSIDQQGVDGSVVDQDAASAAIVRAVEADQNATIDLNFVTVPYKTETNNSISLNYPRYIEVSLSKQHLWAYDNNQAVLSSPVTSGATGAGFPTATGLFHIYYKTTNTYLNGHPYGYNYNVFVKYWMPFYVGYGLHDASWRSSFGGSDYYYGGSHGCVNLPESTAAFLYSWADVGTPVWVHN